MVTQVNVKREVPGQPGLPKFPVGSVEVGTEGVAGDFNRYRHERLRDDPDSAVLLVATETLRELQAAGWPVAPGDLGENITLSELAPHRLRPGVVLRVGGATVQVSRACDPCTNLYSLPYVGPDRGPEFLKATLGRRGWYARVLAPGRVRPGDAVEEVGPDKEPAVPTVNA